MSTSLWVYCPTGLQRAIPSQLQAGVHFRSFLKQVHRTVSHLDLHAQVTSCTQASGIGGSLVHTGTRQSYWNQAVLFLYPGWCVYRRWHLDVFLICLQSDLCLVVSTTSVQGQGIPRWRQHLKALPGFTEELKPGLVHMWLCGRTIKKTDKLLNWGEISITAYSINQVWLTLEHFPACLLAMPTEGQSGVTSHNLLERESQAGFP